MTVVRAYYHCAVCHAGFCPRDRALDLSERSLSPAVTRMVGKSAAMVSFAESSESIGELAGVHVDVKQVERTAEGRDELDAGQIDGILAALRLHADSNDEARKCVDFIIHNRDRMTYPRFRAQGFCTSSGLVEAGCKTAIGTRLKRAGMHWNVCGSDAILALRCCKLSGRFEDFREPRAPVATGTPG